MNTGHKIVDEISQIQFEGNVIPMTWFQHIKKENGKPDTTAIILLSDIIYWYRASEIRDEQTSSILGYKKKFSSDMFQKWYSAWSQTFGFSKKQIRDAVNNLIQKGLIRKELRNYHTKDNMPIINATFFEPIPENIKKITFSIKPENNENEVKTSLPNSKDPLTKQERPPNQNVNYTDTSSEISSETSTSTVGGKVQGSGVGENEEEEKREDISFKKENFCSEQKEKLISDIEKVGNFSPQKAKQYKDRYYAGDKKRFKRKMSRKGLNFSGGWTEAAKEVLEELDPNSEPYRYVMYESQLWDRSKSKSPETIEPNLLLEYTIMYPALLHFRLLEEKGDSEVPDYIESNNEVPMNENGEEDLLEAWRNLE